MFTNLAEQALRQRHRVASGKQRRYAADRLTFTTLAAPDGEIASSSSALDALAPFLGLGASLRNRTPAFTNSSIAPLPIPGRLSNSVAKSPSRGSS